jgi:transposase-like protein
MNEEIAIAQYAAQHGAFAAIKRFGCSKSKVYSALKEHGLRPAKVAKPRAKYDDDQRRQIAHFAQTNGIVAATKEYGVSHSTLARWVKRYPPPTETRHRTRKQTLQERAEPYLQMIFNGASVPEAAKAAGVSRSTLYSWITKCGLTIDDLRRKPSTAVMQQYAAQHGTKAMCEKYGISPSAYYKRLKKERDHA